jgi:hypothetical protein
MQTTGAVPPALDTLHAVLKCQVTRGPKADSPFVKLNN